MSLTLMGLGTAVPPFALTIAESEQLARVLCYQDTERLSWLGTVYHGVGIRQRHSVLGRGLVDDVLNGTRESGSIYLPRGDPADRGPTVEQRLAEYAILAGPLAQRAAAEALEQAGIYSRDITHLVTVSCTGFGAPGVDVELLQELGLPNSTQRTHIGFMGCHGALNGLRVARAFTDADPEARVLLVAVELCSLHYFYGWDFQKIVANALFADGAGAVVGLAEAAAPRAWRLVASGSQVLPDSRAAMTWTVSDHGFVMTLSKQVPRLIATHLRPWLCGWLRRQGLELEQVRSWAIHPGGPRILQAVEESLSLPRSATEAAWTVFREHGNMSSPTILFILDQLIRSDAPRPCVALGFGPGLTIEAALFE